ncbi:MAG: hypothetical protein EA387_04155 [Nitriliruptor sp.]|nr:MAG: hypothetical protein EA387_04155 [Nitriliruptor sp.]
MPQPPDGLSEAALRQWWAVCEAFELEAHEEALLREACRTLTTCDDLAALLEVEGLTSEGSTGQRVVHPALLELRQQRLTLARLYASLRLPESDEDDRPSRATRSGRPQRRGGARGLYAVRAGAP